MIAYDLDILVRDYTQDDLYNLFNKTYVEFTLPNTSEYIVQQDEEMRIDLICYRIYDSTEYVAFLLNFNGIENPLNVMPGDLIKYVDIADIESYKYNKVNTEQVKQDILSIDKGSRKDPNRKEFLEQGYSLPPTFNEEPSTGLQIIGNTLFIGG